MIERKGYRYRIYPTPEQEALLIRTAGCCRALWNIARDQRRWFSRPGRHLGYNDQAAELTDLKAEAPWIKEAPHHCLQQTLRDLDRAYRNFFSGRAGYPRARKRGIDDSFRFPDPKQFRIEADPHGDRRFQSLILPKIGKIRVRLHREILGEMKNVTVCRDGGMWMVSIQTEREVEVPISRLDDEAVGIDLGVAQPIAISTGEVIDLPRISERERTFVAHLQRRVAKAKKGSRNRLKAVQRLNRRMAKIARRRKDAAEKATTMLARQHGVVMVEDLRLRNMTASARGTVEAPGRQIRQKAGLNRSILDVAPGFIRARLGQKLEASGGAMVTVRAAHTSQRCNPCGHIDPENRLSQAMFACTACGHRAHADINAACNIRDRGLGLWGQEPQQSAQMAASTKRRGTSVSAWGGPRVSGPVNQEMHDREGVKEIAA